MPFDKCDTGRCSIALSTLFTTRKPQRLFKPVKVKRLEDWRRTPLNSNAEEFILDIIIFDNITDEYGEVPYEDYTIIRALFQDEKVSDYYILQEGRYDVPEGFVGWDKEAMIMWIEYKDEVSSVPDSDSLRALDWKWNYEVYRAPIVLE